MHVLGIKKDRQSGQRKPRRLAGDMLKDFVLSFVNDLLCASHRQIKLFCEFFKGDAVKQPPG